MFPSFFFFPSLSGPTALLPGGLSQCFGFFFLPVSSLFHFSSILSCKYKLFSTVYSLVSLWRLTSPPPPFPFFFFAFFGSSKALIKIYSVFSIYSSHNHLLASKDCRLLLSELAMTADFQEIICWHSPIHFTWIINRRIRFLEFYFFSAKISDECFSFISQALKIFQLLPDDMGEHSVVLIFTRK